MPWEQLGDIITEARQQYEQDRSAEPVACPNDGEPLRAGPDGRPFCPFDGWTPDQPVN